MDFKKIIENVLQPYKAKFAEAAIPAKNQAAKAKPQPVLTKEEIESERNRLLADSVSPEVFDKLLAIMNKTADNAKPIGTFRGEMPMPLASGGPSMVKNRYIVGERGPEIFEPNVPGEIIPNDEAFQSTPIPRQEGGYVDPMSSVAWQMRHGGIRQALAATFSPHSAMRQIRETENFINATTPHYRGGGGGGGLVNPDRFAGFNPLTGMWREETAQNLRGKTNLIGHLGMALGETAQDVPIPRNPQWWGQPGVTPESRAAAGWYPEAFKHYTTERGVDPRYYNVIPGRAEGGAVDPWHDYIVDASKQYGIDPGHLYGLLAAELDSPNESVSRKGARGRFQFMPETAERVARGTEWEGKPWNEYLLDPRAQTQLAARHWKYLIGKYQDPATAAAAWNAGEKAVDSGAARRYAETQRYKPNFLKGWNKAKGLFGTSVANAEETPVPTTPLLPFTGRLGIPKRPAEPALYPGPSQETIDIYKNIMKPQPGMPTAPGQFPWSPPDVPIPGTRIMPRGTQAAPIKPAIPGEVPGEDIGISPWERRYEAPVEESPFMKAWRAIKELGPSRAEAFTTSPEGYPWTAEELQDLGFEKGSQPFKNRWNVETIRELPNQYNQKGQFIPNMGRLRTMSGPGAETPLPGYEGMAQVMGYGKFPADYKPYTVPGYAGNENVVMERDPSSGKWMIVTKGQPAKDAKPFQELALEKLGPELTKAAFDDIPAPLIPSPEANAEYKWKVDFQRKLQQMILKSMGLTGSMTRAEYGQQVKSEYGDQFSEAEIDASYAKYKAGQ